MPRHPLLRWPWSAGAPLDTAAAAEDVAEACRRAKAFATPAEAAAAMQGLRGAMQTLAERARFPVQSPTEAPDAE